MREIVFDAPNQSEYRIVCKFGYDSFIPHAWWCHIEKKVYYKKWLFFGERKFIWQEVYRCWWDKTIETREELQTKALKFFDEKILLIPRLYEKAMEL